MTVSDGESREGGKLSRQPMRSGGPSKKHGGVAESNAGDSLTDREGACTLTEGSGRANCEAVSNTEPPWKPPKPVILSDLQKNAALHKY